MYMIQSDRDKLINTISGCGADAVTALTEMAEGLASHPDWYGAGYMQGYAHGIDAACKIIQHMEDIR